MKDATAGQMVTYRHLHRGGYGYETCHAILRPLVAVAGAMVEADETADERED